MLDASHYSCNLVPYLNWSNSGATMEQWEQSNCSSVRLHAVHMPKLAISKRKSQMLNCHTSVHGCTHAHARSARVHNVHLPVRTWRAWVRLARACCSCGLLSVSFTSASTPPGCPSGTNCASSATTAGASTSACSQALRCRTMDKRRCLRRITASQGTQVRRRPHYAAKQGVVRQNTRHLARDPVHDVG